MTTLAVRAACLLPLLLGGCNLLLPLGGARDSGASDGPPGLEHLLPDVDADADSPPADDAGLDGSSLCAMAASCKELHACDPGRTDGVYSLQGKSGSFMAWCDMTTLGGGWTLVGRSAGSSTSDPFGWRQATGDPQGDKRPYSLDVAATGLELTELLVGDYTSGKTWGSYVYRVGPVPGGFVDSFLGVAKLVTVTKVGSDCAPGFPGPDMLSDIGFTGRSDLFFFRDKPVDDPTGYGLAPDGWRLNYDPLPEVCNGLDDDCDGVVDNGLFSCMKAPDPTPCDACTKAGMLNNRHGMVMGR